MTPCPYNPDTYEDAFGLLLFSSELDRLQQEPIGAYLGVDEQRKEPTMLKRIWDRIANEPVLVGSVVIAVANLLGTDGTAVAQLAETLVVIVAGLIARSKVTPVRSLGH